MTVFKRLFIKDVNDNFRIEVDLLYCAEREALIKQALRSQSAEFGLIFELTWREELGPPKTAQMKLSGTDTGSVRSKMEAVRSFLSQAN